MAAKRGIGGSSGVLGAVVVAALVVAAAGSVAVPRADAEDAPQSSVPLPLTGRQTVRAAGKAYVVDGKQTIPSGSVIRVEANVRIKGINGASLDVKGGLKVHGVEDSRVRIENVDFSPSLSPDNEMHFDECEFTGCTFAHGEAAVFEGGLTIENSAFSGGSFSVRIGSGYLRIMESNVNAVVTVVGRPGKGKAPEVAIRTSSVDAVAFTGGMMATVRASTVRGSLEAKDFTDLVVDTCNLEGGVTCRQGPEGSFSRLQLLKCNLVGGSKIVLHRPAGPKTKMEKVRVEKFHFARSDGGVDMSDKQIAERIEDGDDDPNVSVKAFWQNPSERRHGL